MFIYCESDHLELLSCKCVDRCQWFCALFMQDFALEVEPQQCPAFSERRACPCVLVGLLVFGATAQSGGRHLVGRQYVGRHLPASWGRQTLWTTISRNYWEMVVGKARWSR